MVKKLLKYLQESIGSAAFQQCTSLSQLIVPKSVKNIGFAAFYGCTALTVYCVASESKKGWDRKDWNDIDGNGKKCLVVWDYNKN